jgi:hypothetical protein
VEVSTTTKGEESEMHITTIGLDLAKQVFAVHGVDEHGKTMVKKMLRRGETAMWLAWRRPTKLPGSYGR